MSCAVGYKYGTYNVVERKFGRNGIIMISLVVPIVLAIWAVCEYLSIGSVINLALLLLHLAFKLISVLMGLLCGFVALKLSMKIFSEKDWTRFTFLCMIFSIAGILQCSTDDAKLATEKELKKMITYNYQLSQLINSLETRLRAEISRLDLENKKLLTLIIDLHTKNENHSAEISRINLKNKKLLTVIIDLRTKNENHSAEISRINLEIKNLLTDLSAKNNKTSKLIATLKYQKTSILVAVLLTIVVLAIVIIVLVIVYRKSKQKRSKVKQIASGVEQNAPGAQNQNCDQNAGAQNTRIYEGEAVIPNNAQRVENANVECPGVPIYE